jgi:hypothetical protein
VATPLSSTRPTVLRYDRNISALPESERGGIENKIIIIIFKKKYPSH